MLQMDVFVTMGRSGAEMHAVKYAVIRVDLNHLELS